MASNGGYGNPGNTVLVLYKVVNSESDRDDPTFNAFPIARSGGTTLKAVKEKCQALRHLNHLGADGYHWRVCVEDRPSSGAAPGEKKSYSWWDIQDENARLPIKEASPSQLASFFAPPKPAEDAATKAVKGTFKSLGKAVNSVVTGDTGGMSDYGPPVSVIAFKLLDLVKMHDDFAAKHGNNVPALSAPVSRPPRQQPAAQRQPPQQQARPAATPTPAPAHVPRRQQQPQAASLLDFGDTPAPAPQRAQPQLHHTTSSPAAFDNYLQQQQQAARGPPPPPNETRAERLKREYEQKKQKANRVWDDIDQRWVEVDPKASLANTTKSQSAPPGTVSHSFNAPTKKKQVGIKLDASAALGKSATAQAGIHKRVTDMQNEQKKRVEEIRAREQAKKAAEDEEDVVRKKLEPKIKAWSEEHGKKKQLRALLASLHTILWPEANWKPVGLGDLLDDSKCKRWFHKASRVVHPDKTGHLDAEKRFLAKRIFDALSQAKSEYDNGAK